MVFLVHIQLLSMVFFLQIQLLSMVFFLCIFSYCQWCFFVFSAITNGVFCVYSAIINSVFCVYSAIINGVFWCCETSLRERWWQQKTTTWITKLDSFFERKIYFQLCGFHLKIQSSLQYLYLTELSNGLTYDLILGKIYAYGVDYESLD